MHIQKNLTGREITLFSCVFLLVFFIFVNGIGSAKGYQVVNTDSAKQAIQVLEQEIASDPENISLHLRLGYLYLDIERWDMAMSLFDTCLELDKLLAEAMNGKGLAYYGKGESAIIPVEVIKKLFKIDNYSKAEKQFKRAIELKPDYLDPLYNLGVNYLAKGGVENYEKSVESLKQVLEKDMVFKDADFMLGVAYQHL
ncbi:MAG: tetratricopeptide repeat protein, partial [bacterium]